MKLNKLNQEALLQIYAQKEIERREWYWIEHLKKIIGTFSFSRKDLTEFILEECQSFSKSQLIEKINDFKKSKSRIAA